MAARDFAGRTGGPADTDTPAISSVINWVCAATPGRTAQTVLGRRSAPPTTTPPAPVTTCSTASRSPDKSRAGTSAAAAKPAMAATGGVPPRRPRSCPPPVINAGPPVAGASSHAPAPAGPPSLWLDTARLSAPSPRRSVGIRPAAWTASTWSSAPARWQSAAASATGWIVPVSLLASIRHTNAGPPWRARARAAKSTRPWPSTGMTSASGRAMRTASCSVAPIRRRRPWPSAWIASASDSVPPEVNTISAVAQPKRAAITSRASSMIRRAARPAAWTELGLPVTSMAASIAARACGRSGSVALASR